MATANARRARSFCTGLIPVLAVGAIISTLPAHAAGATGFDLAPSLVGVSPSAASIAGGTASPEHAPIRLAAKLSSTIKGAAIGSRAARSRGGENKDDQRKSEDETPAASGNEDAAGTSEDNTANSGPFKMNVPGQGEAKAATTPSGQLPSAAAVPDKAGSPGTTVRTLIDRPAAAGAPAAPVQAGAATSSAGSDSPCIAGCYTPTSTQVRAAPVRRAGQTQAAGNAAAAPIAGGIECVAGCDGISGSTIPRAATAVVERSDARAPEKGTANRVNILRGSTRTKQYGVN